MSRSRLQILVRYVQLGTYQLANSTNVSTTRGNESYTTNVQSQLNTRDHTRNTESVSSYVSSYDRAVKEKTNAKTKVPHRWAWSERRHTRKNQGERALVTGVATPRMF